MTQRYFRIMAVVVAAGTCYCSAMYGDGGSMNEQNRLECALQEARRCYRSFVGREPTLENISQSLKMDNTEYNGLAEIVVALDIVALESTNANVLADAVLKCYEKNPTDGNIRVGCVKALLHISRENGVELSRQLLNAQDASLETKLFVAGDLIAVHELFGYPVLKDGLVTVKGTDRRIALALLEHFRRYDGASYNDRGEKIDISKLIEEARQKLQKVLDDLGKAQTSKQK